jgi:hypothetical protein
MSRILAWLRKRWYRLLNPPNKLAYRPPHEVRKMITGRDGGTDA